MRNGWRVTIASPPDRENLVAEIFIGDIQWAEINQRGEVLEVEFYARPDDVPWRLPFSLALEALIAAKEDLVGKGE